MSLNSSHHFINDRIFHHQLESLKENILYNKSPFAINQTSKKKIYQKLFTLTFRCPHKIYVSKDKRFFSSLSWVNKLRKPQKIMIVILLLLLAIIQSERFFYYSVEFFCCHIWYCFCMQQTGNMRYECIFNWQFVNLLKRSRNLLKEKKNVT